MINQHDKNYYKSNSALKIAQLIKLEKKSQKYNFTVVFWIF